jgi:hypothetical protein
MASIVVVSYLLLQQLKNNFSFSVMLHLLRMMVAVKA